MNADLAFALAMGAMWVIGFVLAALALRPSA